jgi:hypothetical protein
MIQNKERQNRIQKIVDSKTVCSDDVVITTFTGEMSITKDDFIVMTHSVQGF